MSRQNIEDAEIRRAIWMEGLKFKGQAIGAAAEVALDADAPPFQIITPTSANRDVLLPAEASSTDRMFCIFNAAATDLDLIVKEDSDTTIISTLYKGQSGFFWCDGTAWRCIAKQNGVLSGPQGIFAAGLFTTVGGDATESITVTGAVATDVPIVTVNTDAATVRSVTKAICTTDAITVTMSGDPSTTHVLNYLVIRP